MSLSRAIESLTACEVCVCVCQWHMGVMVVCSYQRLKIVCTNCNHRSYRTNADECDMGIHHPDMLRQPGFRAGPVLQLLHEIQH